MIRSLTPRLPLLLLPALLFVAFFHVEILDITRVGWLIRGTDNGENALGLHAWLHDAAPGLLRTHLLNAPDGVALLFTDSNPLLALIAWPFATVLPADTQLIGPWLLLCLVLQVAFAWLLLRRFAPGPVALWCGVLLLAALPTLFNRYIHANLFAHWLILWAIWRFLDPVRARSNPGWAVLIAITAMIHSYLLVMVGAIWASATLMRIAGEAWPARLRTLGESAAILAMVGGIAWLLGVGEPHQPSGNYGAFAMPIDALWNPAIPSFSSFLPAIAQRPGRDFEGFQYLGLGLLLALPLAPVVARRTHPEQTEASDLARLRWLAPALTMLTVLAISSYPDFAGHRLPRFAPPDQLANALDLIRASGRLFWPVAYIVVLVAIRILYRLPPRQAMWALAALTVVQVADIAPMALTVRAQTAEATTTTLYHRTPDAKWDGLTNSARDIAFVPGDVTRDLSLFQEIAWRAAKQSVPVRSVYAARPSLDSLSRVASEDAAFRSGMLVPDRLYILIDGETPPAALRNRVRTLGGVRYILAR